MALPTTKVRGWRRLLEFWHLKRAWHLIAPFHSWLHHLCQESRKPEIEMFDVYFKCCSHWLPCKIFEISPSWGLRHRTIYSCIFLGFGWVWSSCHLFPRYFGGFLGDPAFSAVFWGDLQPLLGGCAIYSCLFGVWLGLHVLHSVLVDFLGIPPFQSAVFWGDLQHLTANFGGCAIYACTFSFHLVCMGNGTSIPTVFWWFIVDASISAQPLLGVAPCIPRFWGLVGFTGVHTGMEHLFPWCFGVDPPLSVFSFIYTQPSLKRRLPSAYTSILTYSTLEFMACGGPALKN